MALTLVTSSVLSETNFVAAAVWIFGKINGQVHCILGYNAKHKNVTAFGGWREKEETVLETVLRETKEETLGLLLSEPKEALSKALICEKETPKGRTILFFVMLPSLHWEKTKKLFLEKLKQQNEDAYKENSKLVAVPYKTMLQLAKVTPLDQDLLVPDETGEKYQLRRFSVSTLQWLQKEVPWWPGQRLAPGVVFFKKILSKSDQKQFEKIIQEVKEHGALLPSTKTRNRTYQSVAWYPESKWLQTKQETVLRYATALDPTINFCTSTHLLALEYTKTRGLGYHQDNGKNDGCKEWPVVSFSVGNAAMFYFKVEEKEQEILLESGDVIIFGGPARMMSHKVHKVISQGPTSCRYNFTFRYAPEILGYEEEYETFDAYRARKKHKIQ